MDTAFHAEARAALRGGGAVVAGASVIKTLGKYMITLDDLKRHFGAGWKPHFVELNPLEERAQKLWNDSHQMVWICYAASDAHADFFAEGSCGNLRERCASTAHPS